MEIPLIKIGNSRGIRLSKQLLQQYQLDGSVELVLEKEQIVIRPVKKPRQGWGKAFENMHLNGDDTLLIEDVFEDEAPEEWS